MNDQTVFVVKILMLSTVLSLLVKYGGRLLPIPATSGSALIIVLSPAILLGFILGWRYLQSS